MRYRFAFVSTLNIAVMMLVCSVGCKTFKGDRDAKYAYENTQQQPEHRSKPWVKEVSPASYLEDEKDYLLDEDSHELFAGKLKSFVGQGPDQQIASRMHADANRLFESAVAKKAEGLPPEEFAGEFLEAADLYVSAAERWPKSSLEQESLFRAGESYFFSDLYTEANKAYERLITRYRGTRYMDVVQARRFTIAQFWLELNRESPDSFFTIRPAGLRPSRDTGGDALRILDRIRLDDPTGKLADDATLALANGYFEKKQFLDASDTYEDLRRTFPNSEHQFDAHLFELRSRLQSYQGKDYDAANLQKAERLLKTIVTQFPRQADQHREYLSKEAANIRLKQAQRELTLAEYYEKRNENRAAIAHYDEIVARFGDTPIGETARQKINDLTGKVPEPEQRMSWLVNLFPEAKATKPLIAPSAKDTLNR